MHCRIIFFPRWNSLPRAGPRKLAHYQAWGASSVNNRLAREQLTTSRPWWPICDPYGRHQYLARCFRLIMITIALIPRELLLSPVQVFLTPEPSLLGLHFFSRSVVSSVVGSASSPVISRGNKVSEGLHRAAGILWYLCDELEQLEMHESADPREL